MANADSTNKHLPILNVKMQDGQIVDVDLPEGFVLNEHVYALTHEGKHWTGVFNEGDLLFADPDQIPVTNDYVAIWPKGQQTPFIEQMAMAFMPGSIGKEPHPESNVIAVLSIKRPNGYMRSLECSKVEKVHKIIGKAHP